MHYQVYLLFELFRPCSRVRYVHWYKLLCASLLRWPQFNDADGNRYFHTFPVVDDPSGYLHQPGANHQTDHFYNDGDRHGDQYHACFDNLLNNRNPISNALLTLSRTGQDRSNLYWRPPKDSRVFELHCRFGGKRSTYKDLQSRVRPAFGRLWLYSSRCD